MKTKRPYISAIWEAAPSNIQALLSRAIHAGVEAYKAKGKPRDEYPTLFFRADDIALPSTQCTNMLRIFAEHNTPLALAVVPAWITSEHLASLLDVKPDNNHLWCWHQHGWTHANNAKQGRKCEFGNDRTTKECADELQSGYDKLQELLGKDFCPLFTPPWNRISEGNIQLLKETGFTALSTSASAPEQSILTDIPVNVDLHTRGELSAAEGWNNLFEELTTALSTGRCGIMLHHERMTEPAEEFLHHLLITLQSYPVQSVPITSYMLR